MKRGTKLALALVITSLVFNASVDAKVWRINGNVNISADFREPNAAAASALVQPGDTLYLEGAVNSYTAFSLRKKLVMIGTGYLLSGANGNPGLQYNTNHSRIGNLQLDSLATGSTFIGISALVYINSNVDSITFTRCDVNLQQNTSFPNSKIVALILNKCLGGFSIGSYPLENPVITNCIFTASVNADNVTNGLFRNNICLSNFSISNSYVANNYFLSTVNYPNCTVKYNISATPNSLPAGNNNQNGVPSATMFVGTGSSDARYQLRAGSPGIGAGEPILGITPDIGAYGTPDPYRISGIPAIPTIYALTVPASVPASATTISVTFSTRSNN